MKRCRLCFTGGLGNQLFIYAVYLYLRTIKDLQVMPDFSHYRFDACHYGLEIQKIFNVDCIKQIEKTENKRKFQHRKQSELKRLVKLAFRKAIGYRTFYDKTADSPEVLSQVIENHPKTILAGYFQNPSFADSVKQIIFNSLKTSIDLGERNQALLDMMKLRETVSIHIRRGDYLKFDAYNVFNGFNYYKNAVNYFSETLDNPFFIIFSDDSQWVKDNLKLEAENLFVDFNRGEESFKDMILMSHCDHNIIANSSFSWWGAYLNQNPSKTVICPRMWFKGVESDSIVPASWIKFDN